MDFMQAIQEMKKGKKVRRNGWNLESNPYIKCKENTRFLEFYEASGRSEFEIGIGDIESDDWEIVEDDWKLSDERYLPNQELIRIASVFKLRDIKTFIQKIKEDITEEVKRCNYASPPLDKIEEIIDKRAGNL